jgi:hypothetical protein
VICISTKQEQKFSITLEASALAPLGLAPVSGFTTNFNTKSSGNCLQIGHPPKFKADPIIGAHFCPLFRLGRTSKGMITNGIPLGLHVSFALLPSPGGSSDTSENSQDSEGWSSGQTDRGSMPVGIPMGGMGMTMGVIGTSMGATDAMGAMSLQMGAPGLPTLGLPMGSHHDTSSVISNNPSHHNDLEGFEYPWESENEDEDSE